MNWQRWIRPGLVLSVVLAVFAVAVRLGAIQGDITNRAAARLAADGQTWAHVDVSARQVTLRGTAPSVESQDAAVQAIGQVFGVGRVANGSDLLPIVSPYVWNAKRDGPSVVLSGSVPSEGARTSLLASARRALPNAEINDHMTLGRGAPGAYGAATTYALQHLNDLSAGTITLTDTTLVVTGIAADAGIFGSLPEMLASSLPASVTLGPLDVLPARASPFVWSATFDGKSLTLVGYVPNEVVRETLVATAKATLPGVPIADTVRIASGEPDGFAEAASFALSALDRLKDGGVTLDGLNLDVAGEAKSVDDYEALVAALEKPVPESLKVVSASVTPAVASPYGWQGEKQSDRVILSGFVPTQAAKKDVAEAARTLFAGALVDNRVRVAGGEPRIDWIGAVKFAMTQLAKLDHGKVALEGNDYSIAGAAVSGAAYAALLDAGGRTLPASLELAANDISAPSVTPYQFHAERTGTGVAIGGYVPNEDERQKILAVLSRKFGQSEVSGQLEYASGEPDGFIDATAVALQALNRMAGGSVDITDGAVTVQGFAYRPMATREIADGVTAALPAGFKVATAHIDSRQEGQPLAGEACSTLLQSVLNTGRIAFAGNKADLTDDSYGVLDRVAAALVRCPDTAIEVGAHTDAEGSSAKNRDLTQARADAIVDYLVGEGVMRERLTGVGYGETKPIADNDTDAGREANRRIEFQVLVPEAQ